MTKAACTTEAFRPVGGEPVGEFIEPGGSYGAPLALAWLQSRRGRSVEVAHAGA